MCSSHLGQEETVLSMSFSGNQPLWSLHKHIEAQGGLGQPGVLWSWLS